jgi:N-acetylneuraminate synthase
MKAKPPPTTEVFVLAEVGSTHDGSFGNACRLIDVAAECGADAVKFQTHIAEAETTPAAPNPPYFQDESRYDYFKRTAFEKEQWIALRKLAHEKGIRMVSSPFSNEAVELLDEIGVDGLKIPSGEVTNLPLLELAAKSGKAIYLSSGMSSWRELDQAVDTIRKHNDRLSLMQCTSAYPCPYERVGLNVIGEMQERYGLPVGLSDHTLTNYAALAAVVLGATCVEKHLTLSKLMYGSDAAHSAEPDQFADLVRGIRAVSKMLASPVNKDDLSDLEQMKEIFEKSVVVLVDIRRGERFTPDNIGLRKPGTGLPAKRYAECLDKMASQDLRAGQVLTEEHVQW